MLSKTFATLFYLASGFLFLAFTMETIADLRGKAIIIPTDSMSYIRLGEAGIQVRANRRNVDEKNAPDSIVTYKAKDIATGMSVNGMVDLQWAGANAIEELKKHIEEGRAGRSIVTVDTQFTFMGVMPPYNEGPRNRHVDQKGKYGMFSEYAGGPEIVTASTQLITEDLLILPRNGSQRLGFAVMDTAVYGSLALLFLCLARLFTNFSMQDYFTPANIRLLRNIGILLLIPELAGTLFYWLFLKNIYPVKLEIKGDDYKMLAQYTMTTGLSWMNIFLGFGLVVLSYIFKNGLSIKKENASII